MTYLQWLRNAAILWVAYAVTVLTLAYAAERNLFPLVVAAAAVLVAAAFFLNKAFERQPYSTAGDLVRRVLTLVGFGLVPVAIGWVVPGIRGLVFLTVSTGYLVLGQILIELRATAWGAPWRGLIMMGACGVFFVEGLRALTSGAPRWGLWAAGGAILLFPIGLGFLSEDVLQRPRPTAPWVSTAMVIGGTGLVIVGHLLWPHSLPQLSLLLTLALVGLVGGITAKTDLDVVAVVVVVAAAMAWAVGGTSASVPAAFTIEPNESSLVALGDSYMSGEGASRFIVGTNTKNFNECRRSAAGYVIRAVETPSEAVPNKVVHLGCSGARLRHIYQVPQHPGEPVDLHQAGDRVELPDRLHQLSALEEIRERIPIEPALVIVSIGGNDAGFGEIGKFCVYPGNCSELGQRWLDRLVEVREGLSVTYRRIRSAVGKRTPVLAVPYPVPIDDDGCSWSAFSSAEHRFLHGFTNELNDVVRDAARAVGFHFLGKMATALKDAELRICDTSPGKAGVNFFAFNSVEGIFEDRVNPRNWFHNSLHPNDRGHEAMRDALVDWIETHPDPQPLRPRQTEVPTEVASIEEIMGIPGFSHCESLASTPRYCEGTADEWAAAHTAHVAARASVPLLMVVSGAWVVWLWIIWRRRQG